MESRRLITYHYNSMMENVVQCNPVAIDHAWLFVKRVIFSAYKYYAKYSDIFESDSNQNVQMINECINDENIRQFLHSLRKDRNEYQHNENVSFLDSYDYNDLKNKINKFIKYINSNNSTGFRWKIENSYETIEHKNGAQFSNGVIKEHIKFAMDITELQESNEFTIIKDNSEVKTVNYCVAYGDSNIVFSLPNNIRAKNNSPVFSAIHNILVRSNTISESEFLKSISLMSKELEDVYIYEIMFLRIMCSEQFEQNDLIISIPEIAARLVEYAYQDIVYYYNIFKNIADVKDKLPRIEIKKNLSKYTFEIGNVDFSVEFIEPISISSPVLLSNSIKYEITDENAQYYQLLLKEIFGFEKFRDGQILALKTILANENSNELVILPTGYGKSLIYQFLSFLQPKLTFIVSPTEILINDQIMNLKNIGITKVYELTKASIIPKKYVNNYSICSNMIYLVPKVIESEKVFNFISKLYSQNLINTVVIDECHQVSIWGHRFEAEYFTLLHQLQNEIPNTKMLLFSATSSKRIKEDLTRQLSKKAIKVVQPCSLIRNNINYHFKEFCSDEKIYEDIKYVLESSYASGNTYDISTTNKEPCLTLIICNNEKVLSDLINVLYSSPFLRDYCDIFNGENRIYNSFRNATKRVLLTNDINLAGINIPFLRNIMIIGYPPSKEWLYQESGRVGRYGEESNVDIYINSSFDKQLNSLLNEPYSEYLCEQWKLEIKNKTSFSNLEFLNSLFFNEIIIAETIKNFNDIKRYILVSNSKEYGTVIGKMKKDNKIYFDFSLFILYYLHIIEKWLFNESNEFEEYRYYINMKIDHGYTYFQFLLKSLVVSGSGNKEINEKYSKKVDEITNFDDLFFVTARWISENGYYIRQQMFFNTYQLIKEVNAFNNFEIEENLALYFGSGVVCTAFVKQVDKLDVDAFMVDSKLLYEDINKFNQLPKEDIKLFFTSLDLKEVENDESTLGDVNNLNSSDSNLNSNNAEIISLSDKFQTNMPSFSNLNDNIETENNLRKLDEIKNLYSENVLLYCLNTQKMIDVNKFVSIMPDLIDKYNVVEVRVALERQLEYTYNLNCELALALIEIIFYKETKLLRTKKIFEKLEKEEIFQLLNAINRNLITLNRKKQIDDILISININPYFFNGILGKITRWLIIKKIIQ